MHYITVPPCKKKAKHTLQVTCDLSIKVTIMMNASISLENTIPVQKQICLL